MPPLHPEAVASAAAYAATWLGFRQRYLRVPGVQAAVRLRQELVLRGAWGHADVEADVALTDDHVVRVASHSKTFTATAVMLEVEAGRLRLDDTLGTHLTWLQDAPDVAALTLRDVLSHASGLTRDGDDGDHWQLRQPFPDEDALRAVVLADGAVVAPPLERFKYSNIGFSLLGLVLEAVTGAPYVQHVTRNVIEPLGLVATTPDLDPDARNVTGYSALSYAAQRVPIDSVPTGVMAAATGFASTATDLVTYAAAHFAGDERLLSQRSSRELHHVAWEVEQTPGNAYGLGFGSLEVGSRRMTGHGGGWPGSLSQTLLDRDEHLAVCVLTTAIDGPARELATGIVRLVDLADELRRDVDSVPVDDATAARFVGRYAALWGVLDVAHLGGRLVALTPTLPEPTAAVQRLEVVDDATLRVARGPGYGSVGERWPFTHDSSGAVVSLRANSGITMWPLDAYELPARVTAPGDGPA